MLQDINRMSSNVFQLVFLLSLCQVQQASRIYEQSSMSSELHDPANQMRELARRELHQNMWSQELHQNMWSHSYSPMTPPATPPHIDSTSLDSSVFHNATSHLQIPHQQLTQQLEEDLDLYDYTELLNHTSDRPNLSYQRLNNDAPSQSELSQEDVDLLQMLLEGEDILPPTTLQHMATTNNQPPPEPIHDGQSAETTSTLNEHREDLSALSVNSDISEHAFNEALHIMGFDSSNITYLQDDSNLPEEEIVESMSLDDQLETINSLMHASQSQSLHRSIQQNEPLQDLNMLLDNLDSTNDHSAASDSSNRSRHSPEVESIETLQGAVGGEIESDGDISSNVESTDQSDNHRRKEIIFQELVTIESLLSTITKQIQTTPAVTSRIYPATSIPEVKKHIGHDHPYSNLEHQESVINMKEEKLFTPSHDEKVVNSMGISITTDDIINLPIEQFHDKLEALDLTDNQKAFIKDVRRRGKNKVAAQNSRKRKLHRMTNLADELKNKQTERCTLLSENRMLKEKRSMIQEKMCKLVSHLSASLTELENNSDALLYPYQNTTTNLTIKTKLMENKS